MFFGTVLHLIFQIDKILLLPKFEYIFNLIFVITFNNYVKIFIFFKFKYFFFINLIKYF